MSFSYAFDYLFWKFSTSSCQQDESYLCTGFRKKITAYDYEAQINDNKRYIRLISKDLIADVDFKYKQAMS